MKQTEYRKRIENNVTIESYLTDIETYFNGALNCLCHPKEILDKDEVIAYLKCIPEIIEELRELINIEITNAYERGKKDEYLY